MVHVVGSASTPKPSAQSRKGNSTPRRRTNKGAAGEDGARTTAPRKRARTDTAVGEDGAIETPPPRVLSKRTKKAVAGQAGAVETTL